MNATATPTQPADVAPAPYVWNGDWDDNEQARPYFPAYLARRAELEAAGQRVMYNASFKGHIPGIEGQWEDRAIYLLQTMYDLDADKVKRADFLASGGRVITAAEMTEGQVIRGTIVQSAFYVGGTGWKVFEAARLVKNNGNLIVLPKGRRTHGFLMHGTILVRPA